MFGCDWALSHYDSLWFSTLFAKKDAGTLVFVACECHRLLFN